MFTVKKERSTVLACLLVFSTFILAPGNVHADQPATKLKDSKVTTKGSQLLTYPRAMNYNTMFGSGSVSDLAMVGQMPSLYTSTLLAAADPANSSPEPTAAKDAGQTHASHSLAEINNKLNNPDSDLASLNFKLTWNKYTGDLPGSNSQDSLTLNFQPVFPFPLEDGGNLLIRPTIPLLWQPSFNAGKGGFDENFGLGDSQLVAFYSRTEKKQGYMWGLGAAAQFPTHTDDSLGKDQFQLGPAGFAGLMGKWGSAGVFPQHLWNIGGNNEGYTALTATQFWYWFNVGNGYQIGGSPIILYDWSKDNSREAWTVPVNLGVAKTVMVGKTPVKIKFEGIYYIDQPNTFGPDYGFKLTITPVIQNPLAGLFGKKLEG